MKAFKGFIRSRKKVTLAASIVSCAFLLAVPVFFKSPYNIYLLTMSLMWAGVALSWNLISGYAGIFSLGHQALFGFGAYFSAVLAVKLGWSPWITVILGAMASAVVGAVVSIPSLKLRVMAYITIATLALGEVLRIIVTNSVELTKGAAGLWGIPVFPPIGNIHFDDISRVPAYYLALVMFAIAVIVTVTIANRPIGKSFSAIKDSQDAAESLGVNVRFNKIIVFVIASFLAGLFGGFYAHTILLLTPNAVMGGSIGLQIISYTLIGGIGTLVGPVIGAFLITLGLEALRFMVDYRLIVYSLLLILCVIFMRQGIWGFIREKLLKYWEKWDPDAAVEEAKDVVAQPQPEDGCE